MDQKALELYLYMGSSEPVVKWLKSEGVKTREQAVDKLEPLVRSNVYDVARHIGMGNKVSLAGTANCVERILKEFPDKKKSKKS